MAWAANMAEEETQEAVLTHEEQKDCLDKNNISSSIKSGKKGATIDPDSQVDEENRKEEARVGQFAALFSMY
jgi:hypothetical protein